jgi:hypothetical protein
VWFYVHSRNNAGPVYPVRESISPRQRILVLSRDNFQCQYCGRRAPDVELHVDHRKSIHDDGDNSLENLVTSCKLCNLGKGGLSFAENLHGPEAVWDRVESCTFCFIRGLATLLEHLTVGANFSADQRRRIRSSASDSMVNFQYRLMTRYLAGWDRKSIACDALLVINSIEEAQNCGAAIRAYLHHDAVFYDRVTHSSNLHLDRLVSAVSCTCCWKIPAVSNLPSALDKQHRGMGTV